MDGLTLVCQQGERLFEADEQPVAQVEAISTAFVRVGVLMLRVQPLRGKPLSELGNLELEYRFRRQVDPAHVFRFHCGRMPLPASGVCALGDGWAGLGRLSANGACAKHAEEFAACLRPVGGEVRVGGVPVGDALARDRIAAGVLPDL